MSSNEMNELPLELRSTEARLRALRPQRNPGLVRSVSNFASILSEDGPRSMDSADIRQFTRFVRRAQYRAGVFGLLVGSLLGAVLGGLCVYFALNSPQFRHHSCAALTQIAQASPSHVLSATKDDLPDSVKRVLKYYDGIPAMLENAG